MNHKEIIEKAYNDAIKKEAGNTPLICDSENTLSEIESIVSRAESNKGLLTVIITLITHKIADPNQDIRYHQAQMPNGFSGRSLDTSIITPFMKSANFPAMAESGWLTRSLEQPLPYDMDYPGKIRPENIKKAFLSLIDKIQFHRESPEKTLILFFRLLIRQRDSIKIELAKPHSLSISDILKILKLHFTYKYSCHGAARLPVLAIYAAYKCITMQSARYVGKTLCPLEEHNSADSQSGSIGDITITNEDGTAFEGVEIKHGIPITPQIIADAYEKFKIYNTDRYYILTTAEPEISQESEISTEISRIRKIHGCQVIANGVYPTLKYYLRIIKSTAEFIDIYAELLKSDSAIKFQHKQAWNDIISRGIE